MIGHRECFGSHRGHDVTRQLMIKCVVDKSFSGTPPKRPASGWERIPVEDGLGNAADYLSLSC